MKIRELTISARAKMCLLSAGYEDIEDLELVPDEELIKIKNLNEKGVAEIRTVIDAYFTDDENDDVDWRNIEDDEAISDPKELTIEEVELSVRSYNCLKRAGIQTIGELCDMTMEDLMKVRSLGRKGQEEVLAMLKAKGLRKGTDEEDDEDEIIGGVNTNIPIDELEFGVRTYNCLKRAGIRTLRDICKKTPEDMMKVRNLGRRGQEEVLAMLKAKGLTLKETEEDDELFTSDTISSSIDTESKVFSLKENFKVIDLVENENEEVLRQLDIQLKQLSKKYNA